MSGSNLSIAQAKAIQRLVSWATEGGRRPGADGWHVGDGEALAAARHLADAAFTRLHDTGQGARFTGEDLLALRPAARAAALDLLTRIHQVEQPDGSWPGGDVVDVLAAWFAELCIPVESRDG